MKHTLHILTALALVVLLASCGEKAKYADVKDALQKEIDAVGAFVTAANAATDAKAQADAINAFVDSFQPAMKEADAAVARYPEVQNGVSEELKPLFLILSANATDSADAVQKIRDGAFAQDPGVAAALERMGKMAGQ